MSATGEGVVAGPMNHGDQRGHILVVDDDEYSRSFFEEALAPGGYKVYCARDGVEALQIVNIFTPDLILVDYQMPRMDGLELSRLLRERRETRLTPIVMITGFMGTEMAVKALDAGVDDFLTKPSNPVELQARVRAHLRSKFLVDQLEDLENVIVAMTKTVDAKDPHTEGHSARVAAMAVRAGRTLGLSEWDLRCLRLGGLLHDIGKIGVPDRILQKPQELTEEEREILKRHAAVGQEICQSIHSLTAVAHIIRHHHEKLDGSGYPDGLKGGQIPLLTRILTICDIYDSLTTLRPYRQPLTREAACETLRQMAGDGKIDASVVEALANAELSNAE